jgi:anti-sigma regulatory factor (Ser/Thr protein kinase)
MIRIAVTENSGVAEARRQAGDMAVKCGFDEGDAGRVRLVVTELATNIVKHGAGGEILVGGCEQAGEGAVEVLALDSGAGIPRLNQALVDGYSSAGTPGNGLGAILRQSQFSQVATWPGRGTAIFARLERGGRGPHRQPAHPAWGGIGLPYPGEQVCGDAWCVDADGDTTTFFVADGLGHGPQAADAANEAVRVFQRHKSHRVPTLLDYVHGALRSTRGAAIAVARLHHGLGKLEFGGIGNIAGAMISMQNAKRLVSMPGTAGHNVRKIQAFEYSFAPQDLLVLHSDGLGTSWNFDRYSGLAAMHPMLIAGVLCRDFWRHRDDVTVVIGRGEAAA